MRIAVLFAMACGCAAETSVRPPFIGTVRDCAGRMHDIYGVAGAFVIEPAPGVHRRAEAPARKIPDLKLPGPAGELQQIAPEWLSAWPYAIRLTNDGAKIYRLPVPACGGRP